MLCENIWVLLPSVNAMGTRDKLNHLRAIGTVLRVTLQESLASPSSHELCVGVRCLCRHEV